MCDISALLCAVVLINKNQKIFEYLLFYGSLGAVNALMTPLFIHGTHIVLKVDYMIQHAIIFVVPIFLMFNQGMQIKRYSVFRASVIMLCFLVIPAHIINMIGGTNYIYTMAPPFEDHPLIIGEWPWYYLGFIGVGLVGAFLILFAVKLFYPKGYNKDAKDRMWSLQV